MSDLFKPDMPGPSAEEIRLKKAQAAATAREESEAQKKEAKMRQRRNNLKRGMLGLSSLSSSKAHKFGTGGE